MTESPTVKAVDMKAVQSSNIAAVGHEGSTLYVRFKSGPTWKYSDVNEATYQEMLGADSIGSYFGKHIKPNHKTEKVGEGT